MVPRFVSNVTVFGIQENSSDPTRGADVVQGADLALGNPRDTDPPAMENEQMRQHRPILSWKDLHQLLLGFDRICLGRKSQPQADTTDMGIHNYALVCIEGISENHVCGFSSHTREPNELVHCARNFTAMRLDDAPGHADETLRLVVEKPCRFYELGEFLRICISQCASRRVFREHSGRDHVHALVRALRAQDRCDEKLERRPEIQLAMRVGVRLAQPLVDFLRIGGRARLSCGCVTDFLLHVNKAIR